jgi:TrmH family RNA methyltransferase
VALLVGNEGAGLPVDVERAADARIRIPMASGIESLNAAAAAAVLFYEAARQRNSAAAANIQRSDTWPAPTNQ